ncbi:MAG: ABC transporter permease [Eubacteriales bacterium]
MKKKSGNAFLKIMGDQRRQNLTIPLLAIVLSLLVGALIFFALGTNPLTAYQSFLQGSGLLPKGNYAGGKSMLTDFTSFLNSWTPTVFAALAVSVALRAGLFNIGVSGQMLLGGFVASVTVGYSELSAVVAKPLVLLVAMTLGGLCGMLIGWLKYRFNINEVVSTIMANYIIQYIVSFLVSNYLIDPVSRQSKPISANARLTLMNTSVGDLVMDIPLGVILAVITAFALYVLLEKTIFGFHLKSVGTSPSAASYSGMDVGKNQVLAMALSGGLAGLAGATYYLGLFHSIPPKVLSIVGFDAIAVSLLANSHPIGILFSSFLMTILSKGSTYMSSTTGLLSEIASVLTGIILLVSACGSYGKHLLAILSDKLKQGQKEG